MECFITLELDEIWLTWYNITASHTRSFCKGKIVYCFYSVFLGRFNETKRSNKINRFWPNEEKQISVKRKKIPNKHRRWRWLKSNVTQGVVLQNKESIAWSHELQR